MNSAWEVGGVVQTAGTGTLDTFEVATAYHPPSGVWVVLVRVGEYVIPLTPAQALAIAEGLVECAQVAQTQAERGEAPA